MGFREWEGCAEQLRAETRADDRQVHPRLLVATCGLALVGTRGIAGCWLGRRVYYDHTARPERQTGTIAHELGHFALDRYNEEQSERGAAYTGAAILVPRRAIDGVLRRVGWDMDALRADFPHASAELLARRIADVREAVVTIVDGRRIKARVSAPWLPPPSTGLTREERRVLAVAMTERRQIDEGWIRAIPVIDPDQAPRVILIAEREQLELRF